MSTTETRKWIQTAPPKWVITAPWWKFWGQQGHYEEQGYHETEYCLSVNLGDLLKRHMKANPLNRE